MLMVFTRATVMYVVVMVTMRLMGKRMIGQLQPFELAIAMLMADLAAAPLSDIGIPLMYGVVPMLALLLAHSVISALSYRFGWVRRLVSGRPSVVIRDGKIDHAELVKQCYSLGDLMEALRAAGHMDISQVGEAVIETNGQLSACPTSDNRPPNTGEMDIHPGPEGVPLVLMLDGKPDRENLNLLGRDAHWLNSQLEALKLSPKRTLLCTLDRQGRIYAQDYAGNRYRAQPLSREDLP